MDQILHLSRHWQAVDPARNVARDYRVSASRDLFGWIVVEQRWGRIGSRGQSKRLAFADETAARRNIARIEARRATSLKRVKVTYRECPS